ncbi:hypothetical protein [uncultured Maricaulis sp.]|uniref:hypothetical protein n=1 Tax=uncultured Maricaulis sp. TaxID=174710 RepID=UPI0030DA41C5
MQNKEQHGYLATLPKLILEQDELGPQIIESVQKLHSKQQYSQPQRLIDQTTNAPVAGRARTVSEAHFTIKGCISIRQQALGNALSV